MEDPKKISAEQYIANHVRGGELTYKPGREQQQIEPQPWQLMPELPTPEELLAKEAPSLPANITDGKDIDKREYLGIQHRLYRHEGTEHLRKAVKAYADPRGKEDWKRLAFVYTQVRCRGYLFGRAGAACRISFSTEKFETKVLWDTLDRDRLTAGNLIALSPAKDGFQNVCLVAVVAARPLSGGLMPEGGEGMPPMIDIYWADHSAARIDPAEELVMIEAKNGFYETVRHPMRGLQHAAHYESRFDRYIVDGHRHENAAEYVESEEIDPAASSCADALDVSQSAAFDRMTTKELAIVQGPPGTGKTFTSLVALDSLVKSFASQPASDEDVSPIIVAAQTNHALDQLLSGCVNFNNASIARLGGRSKIHAMEEKTLYRIQQNLKDRGVFLPNGMKNAESSRRWHIKQFQALVKVAFPQGLISARELRDHGIISEPQYDSLNNDEWESLSAPSGSSASRTHGGPVQPTPEPSKQGDKLLDSWLVGFVEKDTTCHYEPPTGQLDPTEQLEVGDLQAAACHDEQQAEEDEKERLKGEFVPIQLSFTGSVVRGTHGSAWINKAARLLRDNDDLYEIKPSQRGLVYRYLRQQLVARLSEEASRIFERHGEACKVVKIEQWKLHVKALQHEKIQIVGCTTTGLTKYRGLLCALKPNVLLIEEAAETREAHVTSALFPTLQQLILVGDHQQLVPNVDVRELGQEPYNLHVSLFERLVNLGLPYSQLCVQRRMIPAIGKVLRQFYPDVADHDIVKDAYHRPPVPGLETNMWWFQHCWQELRNDTFSYSNLEEAKMIVGFAQYLVQNGMKPKQITILTFYNSQVDLLRSLLKLNDWFSTYHEHYDWTDAVRTVDGFQGEENDVIMLSVVRSRQQHERASAGFVANENRAVVALSRAKRGLYVFGNSTNLLQSSDESHETWGKVLQVFRETLGKAISVQCQNHGKVTDIASPEDWARIAGGGCQKTCEESCSNGHPCELPCHIIDHALIKCRRPCIKVLTCGHRCRTLCCELCRCAAGCDAPKLEQKTLPVRPKKIAPVIAAAKPKSKQKPKQTANQGRGELQSSPSMNSLVTSDELLTGGTYRSRFCVDGPGDSGVSSGPPVIHETFKQTSTDEDGTRVVESVSVHTRERERATTEDEEEDLIDLRDEVKPELRDEVKPELLIDFGE